MRLFSGRTAGLILTYLCPHKFGEPTRYTHIHSEVTCSLCGYAEIIPTPEHMKPEPDWKNAVEVVQ